MRWLAGFIVLFGLGAAALARAQPMMVRVRAESRLELRSERAPEGIVVTGALRDDLGQPLAGSPVILTVTSGDSRAAVVRTVVATGADGEFRAPIALAEHGMLRLRALFEGDTEHEKSEVERPLDLDRVEVRLDVRVPDRGTLDLGADSHLIQIVASSVEGGAGLAIELMDELRRPLREGMTDAEGRVEFALRSAELGPPAAGRLIVRSSADSRRAAAQTEVPILRVTPTVLELATDARDVPVGGSLLLRGTLRDRHAGLDRRAVGVYTGDRLLGTLLTQGDGRFEGRVELPAEVEPGLLELQARFESDAPWRKSTTSAFVQVHVVEPSGLPWSWLALSATLTLLAIVALARRGPGATEPAARRPARPPLGIEPARRSRARPDRAEVAGTVRDARDGEPLAGAVVRVVHAAGSLEATTDALGRFELVSGETLQGALEVSAPGFAPSRCAVTLPHRGEWSDCVIHLASLRERALEAFDAIAAAAPQAQTPREVAQQLRGTPAVSAIAHEVERAGYADPAPTELQVEAIESSAKHASTEARAIAAPTRPGSRDLR